MQFKALWIASNTPAGVGASEVKTTFVVSFSSSSCVERPRATSWASCQCSVPVRWGRANLTPTQMIVIIIPSHTFKRQQKYGMYIFCFTEKAPAKSRQYTVYQVHCPVQDLLIQLQYVPTETTIDEANYFLSNENHGIWGAADETMLNKISDPDPDLFGPPRSASGSLPFLIKVLSGLK